MEKVSPDSKELRLAPDDRINKKLIRLAFFGFVFVVGAAVVMAFMPARGRKSGEEDGLAFSLNRPDFLNNLFGRGEDAGADGRPAPNTRGGENRRTGPDAERRRDPLSGVPVNPERGLIEDREKGLLTDPETGAVYDSTTGKRLEKDPETGLLVNPESDSDYLVDPETGERIDPDTNRRYGYDPETGFLNDPETGEKIDPETNRRYRRDPGTGFLVDPDTGERIDPDTGKRYRTDPGANHLVDTETGERIDPATGEKIDSGTGGLTNRGNGDENDRYRTYDRSPAVPAVVATGGGRGGGGASSNNRAGGGQNGGSAGREPDKSAMSGILYALPGVEKTAAAAEAQVAQEVNPYKEMAEALGANGRTITAYEAQNLQQAKKDWLDETRANSSYTTYLENLYTEQISPAREIWAGSVIPITLTGGANSDLPGDVSAQVIADVYDSHSGQNLLIPKGSKVFGAYDSTISFDQDRLMVVWNRILRPDGVSLLLNGMQGAEIDGAAGFRDQVDNHYAELVTAMAAGTGYNFASQIIKDIASQIPIISGVSGSSEGISQGDEMAKQAASQIIDKLINREPTIIIRPGYRGNILVNRDIILPLYDDYYYQ